MKLHIWNTKERRNATIEEIEHLFLNCYVDQSGYAEINYKKENGIAIDPLGADLEIVVVGD